MQELPTRRHYILAKRAMARGDSTSAKDEFLNTLNAARDEYGAEAKYLLAQIFYNQKEYKQSIETLLSLNKDFEEYQDWVGKSYLVACRQLRWL